MADSSINTTSSEQDHEDLNIDLHDLVGDEPYSSPQSPDFNTSPVSSPLKKYGLAPKPLNCAIGLSTTPVLSPSNQANNITNELFQVTSNRRRLHQHEQHFLLDDDEFAPVKRLNNDKFEKMVNDLRMSGHQDGEFFDFELDDQMRSRFYKGRFNNKPQFNADTSSELDNHLNSYLGANENKENDLYSDPLRVNKNDNSINKSKKQIFKPSRRILSSTNLNNNRKSSIPVLQPISNVINVPNQESSQNTSPKRICIPKHRSSRPGKPSIRYKDRKTNIFIVDSLTGQINDATLFGTELNASNCDDFPLPENVNEIVQIPTNDDSKKKSKMAIIKLLHNKYFNDEPTNYGTTSGFYNQTQFDIYRSSSKTGVEVVAQSLNEQPPSPKTTKPAVRWADNLEW